MRRKIIQIADSTQLVSLPRQWCLKHNLKKGDELEVTAVADELIISTANALSVKKAVLDLRKLDPYDDLLWHSLYSYYRSGCDEIEVYFENMRIYSMISCKKVPTVEFIHDIISGLIGYEIIRQTDHSCTIRDVVNINREEYGDIFRRTTMMLVQNADAAVQAIQKCDAEQLQAVIREDRTINRFTDLCLRMISKGASQSRCAASAYYIVSSVEEIGDCFSQACQKVLSNKQKKFPTADLAELASLVALFVKYLYSLKPDELSIVIQKRWETPNKIKNSPFREEITRALTVITRAYEEQVSKALQEPS